MPVQSRTISRTELVRRAAAALVYREYHQVGSHEVAYENVGQMIGASGSWLRKFVKGYGTGLNFVVGCNIQELYVRLCQCIEADADRREYAAHQSDPSLDQGLEYATQARQGHASGVPEEPDD